MFPISWKHMYMQYAYASKILETYIITCVPKILGTYVYTHVSKILETCAYVIGGWRPTITGWSPRRGELSFVVFRGIRPHLRQSQN